MSDMRNTCLAVFAMGLGAFAISNAGAAAAGACGSDGTLEVCVTSASLTRSSQRNSDGGTDVRVSLTLQITNQTDYPLEMLFVEGMSFEPVNAASVTDSDGRRLSGIGWCLPYKCSQQQPTEGNVATFAPKQPLRIQITYGNYIEAAALPLMQAAQRASFSAQLSIVERGKQRFVPIPLPEFPFGNGLTN